MLIQYFFRDGKTQAGSLTDLLGGKERFEDPFKDILLDTGSVVGQTQLDKPILYCGTDRYRFLFLTGRIDGISSVCEEIDQNLLDFISVEFD